MALRERNSALRWAATRPEDNTPVVAVAVGHFVQVGLVPLIPIGETTRTLNAQCTDTPQTVTSSPALLSGLLSFTDG